ncbi:solute carrier family 13 member 2-like [Scyliorhinus canicula]|uniref:solute carrier family 13 member 2-like n=1 Tax=Scyliorhinus canicula TaxID=7830 RepID=UPI0018F36A00|nr:solute carrier family 13 member 2-like [Scyliorhinus canicula]
MGSRWRIVWAFRNQLIIFLVPLLLLPLPVVIPTKEAACGFTIILMATYWCTEALPLAVTALLPVLLFPMFGIMESSQVCMQYLKDTNMLLVGGLMVAVAVEHWNLHKRIALRVLLIVGVKPALLMLGFMIVTAFLSMWISNTATTAMMVPIAQAVLDQLHKVGGSTEEQNHNNKEQEVELQEKGTLNSEDKVIINSHAVDIVPEKFYNTDFDTENIKQANRTEQDKNGRADKCNGQLPTPVVPPRIEENENDQLQRHLKLSKGMSLSVCYAASIGGTATLTGTTPNLIMVGQLNDLFPENGDVINFASWFGFSFPCMFIMLLVTWIWLQIMFLGLNLKENFGCGSKKSAKDVSAYRVMKMEFENLGKMSFAEIAVLILFILLVLLWFTRDPGFIPGWASVLFNKNNTKFVTDATVVMFIAMIMFIVPSDKPRLPCFNNGRDLDNDSAGKKCKYGPAPAILNWKTVQDNLAWNIVVLLGGGFALAKGSEESGLSQWLGNQLTPLEAIPAWAIVMILCLLIATFTECASNVATTSLFLPILAAMARRINLHPLYVMLPCTLCASFAFMLPVATPPNSIVFSYGYLKVSDMAKTGVVVNLIGVLVITLAVNTWGKVMFDLGTFPAWANATGPL